MQVIRPFQAASCHPAILGVDFPGRHFSHCPRRCPVRRLTAVGSFISTFLILLRLRIVCMDHPALANSPTLDTIQTVAIAAFEEDPGESMQALNYRHQDRRVVGPLVIIGPRKQKVHIRKLVSSQR